MNILLLHGAIGAADQLTALQNALAKEHIVHSISFIGHGDEALITDFSIDAFANQVVKWIKETNPGHLCIFGYSMGGYVAMYIALHHPELVEKIITLGTKFHWDNPTSEREIQMLNPETIEQKLPAFAKELEERHKAVGWKKVLNRTAAMLLEMGLDNPIKLRDVSTINIPCLIMLGDNDKMVTLVETFSVYNELPNAQLGILPGTPHAIEKVNVDLLVSMTRNFLSN